MKANQLRTGRTKSCGCLQREKVALKNYRHGASDTPEHETWQHIKKRCLDKNSQDFRNYGARGITICPAWRDNFQAFLDYVGPRPSPQHSIDRFPNNTTGNYEPGNVRWATRAQQNRNKRNNAQLTVDGQTLSMAEWADRSAASYTTIRSRLSRGWSHEDAVLKPVRHFYSALR